MSELTNAGLRALRAMAKMAEAKRPVELSEHYRTQAFREVLEYVDKIEVGEFSGSGHCKLMLAGIKVKLSELIDKETT